MTKARGGWIARGAALLLAAVFLVPSSSVGDQIDENTVGCCRTSRVHPEKATFTPGISESQCSNIYGTMTTLKNCESWHGAGDVKIIGGFHFPT